MYPGEFDYHRADSVAEALELLDIHAEAETELLAGGHSLLPTMKSGLASPDVVIDIGRIPGLDGIEDGDGTTTFGALTTYADVVDSGAARANCPAFAEAAGEIGDVQVRNAGTVGGNLAHADPASDLPAAALVADATIHATGPDGEREIDAEEYFIAMYATALGERELLTAVEVPDLAPGDVGTYVKKPSPSSGYAMVGIAVRLETDGDRIERACVAANGAFDHAMRLDDVEDAIEGVAADEADPGGAAALAAEGVEEWQLMDDLQASAAYRRQLLEVYTERAIQRAIDRL